MQKYNVFFIYLPFYRLLKIFYDQFLDLISYFKKKKKFRNALYTNFFITNFQIDEFLDLISHFKKKEKNFEMHYIQIFYKFINIL